MNMVVTMKFHQSEMQNEMILYLKLGVKNGSYLEFKKR